MLRRTFILLVVFGLLAFVVQGQAESAQVRFDFSQELGEISPYVYGSNHGPWSGVSLQMQEEAAVTGVTFLRFPGGRWGDQNNVTPQQLDLFMIQVRAWNIEPSIHVRLEGGSPEQAAELVR